MPAAANHALFAFSQLTFLFASIVYGLAKLVRPDDDALYAPKSDVRVSVTGAAVSFGQLQPSGAAEELIPTAALVACAERMGCGCCVACACCRRDAADDDSDNASGKSHGAADAALTPLDPPLLRSVNSGDAQPRADPAAAAAAGDQYTLHVDAERL